MSQELAEFFESYGGEVFLVTPPAPERNAEEIEERARLLRERKGRATPFFEELTALCHKHNVRLSASGDERGCDIYLQDNDNWAYIATIEDGEYPGEWNAR